MSDPVNSSNEAVATAHARHDIFNPSAPECSYGEGFRLQPSDHESTVADGHTITNSLRYGCWLRSHDAEVAAAVRAEAVADERRRIVKQVRAAKDEQVRAFGRDPGAYFAGRVDGLEDAARVVAAGSVPVATPEPEWHNAYDCDAGLADIHPQFVCERPYRVATPPAEPAQAEPMVGIFDVIAVQQNYRRHLLSLDPSPEVRAALDEAIPAPSQPVTCEHGETEMHPVTPSAWLGVWCPGPVSVPKESSE